MILRISCVAAVFVAFASAQTLSLVSGAGQLISYGSGEGSQPIVFSVLNNGTPVPNQTITFTNSNGSPATSLIPDVAVTDSNGNVAVIFNPAYINGNNFEEFPLQAHFESQTISFNEISAAVPPTQLTLTAPPAAMLNPLTAKAGQAGPKITVDISASYSGNVPNVAVRIIPIHTKVIPPPGTVLQTATCAEAGSTPEGNVFTNSSGIATCTPIFTLPNGSLNLTYDTSTFKISVGDTFAFGPFAYNISAAPLVINGPQGAILLEGAPSALAVTATGGVQPYAFSLAPTSGPLPGGLSLESNGQIAGSSNTPGLFKFSVVLKDHAGTILDSPLYSIAVSGGVVTISPQSLPDAVVGQPYAQSISVAGGVPPYKLALLGLLAPGLVATPDPSGLSIKISGTATAPSSNAILVTVSDATGTVTPVPVTNFQVVAPLAVASVNPQLALISTTYQLQVPITGGLPPYTVTATGLPSGFTVNAAGLISGYTTAAPGIYPVAVSVVDTLGLTASTTFNLELSGGALGLGAGTYPAQLAGTLISQPLAITGGVPPYSFTVTSKPDQTLSIGSNGILTGTFAAAGTQVVAFSVTDSNGKTQSFTISIPVQPAITAAGIANSASFIGGSVAPGEIVSLFGNGLGPDTPVGATLSNNLVSTVAGGTQVMFGSYAAPILYASSTQLNVVVPFEVTPGQNVAVTVTSNGQTSTALTLPVIQAVPGVFIVGGTSAPHQAAVLNQNLTLNGPTNPAAAGTVIVVYATGGGLLSTTVTDGELPTALVTIADTTLTVGGQLATIQFAGLAPGFAGLLQINATLPSGIVSGSTVPIVLSVAGTDSSSQTATIAVQ